MNKKLDLLSGNQLKIIAAVCMTFDHAGFLLFPQIQILRIIGRIAFPIFAFMIAEGCYYTNNKLKYFLGIFALGILCQIVYYVVDHSLFMGILITFSFSILLIYLLQFCRKIILDREEKLFYKCFWAIVFIGSVVILKLINDVMEIDYGFWGSMVPVVISFVYPVKNRNQFQPYRKRCLIIQLVLLALLFIPIVLTLGYEQIYLFLALPFLLMYSGQRGKRKMKYFFYVFYPLHLVLLQLIQYLMQF